jgi:hypothetical protein
MVQFLWNPRRLCLHWWLEFYQSCKMTGRREICSRHQSYDLNAKMR